MSLSVSVRHRLGSFSLDAAFETSGRLTALFGPSGSGKTSLVNMIGGLIKPDAGRIAVDGRVLVDREKGVYLARHRRRIGYVFQDSRLFPHLSVARNLRYGAFFTPAAERYASFDDVVGMLSIGHLLERRPEQLSGGEKQRVAIGRALLASPKLLLMDEPLASLDEGLKSEILPFLEQLRDVSRVPIIYVSHSVAEVARLASDIVMLGGGKVLASGPARTILGRLDLLPQEERGEGGAVIDAEIVGHDLGSGLFAARTAAGHWLLPKPDVKRGDRVKMRIRARDVMIATERPNGISALNIVPGVVSAIDESTPGEALVSIDCGGDTIFARITAHSLVTLQLAPGSKVFAVVKAVSFDRTNTARATTPADPSPSAPT